MTRTQEQKIIVLTGLQESDNGLIQHGLKLALIFKKELCLVHNMTSRKQTLVAEAKEKLQAYATVVKNEIPALSVSSLVLSENKTALPDVLVENHEGIIIVTNALTFKKETGMLGESPIPVLFVHPESAILDYNHLVQPLDLRKENSDSSLWCSYFGRFNKAEIVSVAANDNSKDAKQGVAKNVLLSKKLYQKFKIEHRMYKGTKSSFRNSFEALELALASDCNLYVMLGSSEITPLDYLVGLPERKIIRRAGKLPVLVINPRRDNYILCD